MSRHKQNPQMNAAPAGKSRMIDSMVCLFMALWANVDVDPALSSQLVSFRCLAH